jgi:hypothetical protein
MNQPFAVSLEQAYTRNVLFAVELLDAVTLSRISQGVEVVAEGLQGSPRLNASGFFVWLQEDFQSLRRLLIRPNPFPYESREYPAGQPRPPIRAVPFPYESQDYPAAQVKRPLTSIELSPLVSYPFAVGTTGLLGTLVEERAADPRISVPNAEVRLQWLDEDGATWRDAPVLSHTNENGDFAAILRLSPTEIPLLDAKGAVSVHLRVRRNGGNERGSAELKLAQGRVADPSTFPQGKDALLFAWDELQP